MKGRERERQISVQRPVILERVRSMDFILRIKLNRRVAKAKGRARVNARSSEMCVYVLKCSGRLYRSERGGCTRRNGNFIGIARYFS